MDEDQLFCVFCGHKVGGRVVREDGPDTSESAPIQGQIPIFSGSVANKDYTVTINEAMAFLHLHLHKIIAFLCVVTLLYPILYNSFRYNPFVLVTRFSYSGANGSASFESRPFELWKFFISSHSALGKAYSEQSGIIITIGVLLLLASITLVFFAIKSIRTKDTSSIRYSTYTVYAMIAVGAIALIAILILNFRIDSLINNSLASGYDENNIYSTAGDYAVYFKFAQPTIAYVMVIGGIITIFALRKLGKIFPVNK